jgi:two-component system response regulator DesR
MRLFRRQPYATANADARVCPILFSNGAIVIHILIISELGLLRGALHAVLSKESDLTVTAESATGPEAVSIAREMRPDIVLVDLDTHAGIGLSTARRLADELPGCAVIVLAGRQTSGELREALDVRIRGFANKNQSPGELAALIRRVAAGDRVIDPATAQAALAVVDNPLTVRECEVLGLAAEGLPTRAIANRLYLTEGAVRNHLSMVLRKTGCRNRLQAIHKAQDAGWL